jgi:hypothetical protein
MEHIFIIPNSAESEQPIRSSFRHQLGGELVRTLEMTFYKLETRITESHTWYTSWDRRINAYQNNCQALRES